MSADLRFRLRLQEEANRRAALARGPDFDPAAEGILDFFERANPDWIRPYWLEDYASWMETALTGDHRICGSIPPRHGKTETFCHAASKLLHRMPEARIGYASYNDIQSRKKGYRAQQIAVRDGHQLDPKWTGRTEWRTTKGGSFYSAGVGGAWTGDGFNFIFVDDPIKDRVQAESLTYRERAWDWLTDVIGTRMAKGGSVFVNMTRWHKDDLIGRCLERQPDVWTPFNHAAILDENTENERALAPELWDLEWLKKQKSRMTLYGWMALYMGRPTVRGGSLFEGVSLYRSLPPGLVYSKGIGIDLAYAAKTKSDSSAYVVVIRVDRRRKEPVFYVVDAGKSQVKRKVFGLELESVAHRHPGAKWLFRYGGTELDAGESIRDENRIPLMMEATRGDKWSNAQDWSAAWNDGRVFIPEDAPWAAEFITQHQDFTGKDGDPDDWVDAAVSAHRVVSRGPTRISNISQFNVLKDNPFKV